MNDASRWRIAVARRVEACYRQDSRVRAFMIGGSVSRGLADRYSDLEIGVFWTTTPSPEERQTFLTGYDGVM